MARSEETAVEGPMVMYANYCVFHSEQKREFGPVQSRMFLWCVSGEGVVAVNGGPEIAFKANDFCFLPFMHHIRYRASALHPFTVGSVHVIPELAPGAAIDFLIRHTTCQGLPDPLRLDCAIEGVPELFFDKFSVDSALWSLVNYIVRGFLVNRGTPLRLQQLAVMLLHEIRLHHARSEELQSYPPVLLKIMRYIEQNRNLPLGVDDLSAFSGYSRPTVFRWFREHLDSSPRDYIMKTKLEHAALLLRDSELTIKEIAEELGIDDYFYFFKLFRKYHRSSPAAYRKNHRTLHF